MNTLLTLSWFAGGWGALTVVLVLAVGSIVWAVGDAFVFAAWATAAERRRDRRACRHLRRRAEYADRCVAAARLGGLFDETGGQ